MAEIVLKIPKEFEQDFNTDKFKECFERVLADCKAWDYAGLSGNYEHETLEMLLDAFNEAAVLPKGHGKIGDLTKLYNEIDARNKGKNKGKYTGILALVGFADTIIEADKEKMNEK